MPTFAVDVVIPPLMGINIITPAKMMANVERILSGANSVGTWSMTAFFR